MNSKSAKISLSLAFVAATVLAACSQNHSRRSEPHGDESDGKAGPPQRIEITPTAAVNTLGAQHVLVASVLDENGKPVCGARVEWMLARGGVGEIVDVDPHGGVKVDNHFATTKTQGRDRVLGMGTASRADDVLIRAGQTWIATTAPLEGTSHVIAYAPGVRNWSRHAAFATTHWRDVKVTFPADASSRVGTPHEIRVNVVRNSDGTPLPNQIVSFRILDGPAATLGAGDTATARTDGRGIATAKLALAGDTPGVSHVEIQVIRPANEVRGEPAVLLATAVHTQTWVAPALGIRKCVDGPGNKRAVKSAGEEFDWLLSVYNDSPFEIRDVVVTDSLPRGIVYVSSVPEAVASGQDLTWELGTLSEGGTRTITIRARTTAQGVFEGCAVVYAEDGRITDRDCATVEVTAPGLEITRSGPEQAILCDTIPYRIVVRNAGDRPATGVRVTSQLPDGMTTADRLEWASYEVGVLQPGQSLEFASTTRADRPGEYTSCSTVAADGIAPQEACATTRVVKPELVVELNAPDSRSIGRPAEFTITVRNTGDGVARGTVLRDAIPARTRFDAASRGGTFSAGVVTWLLGDLAPGDSVTRTVTVIASAGGSYSNRATATAHCAEATASAAVAYEGIPALSLVLTDDPDPVEIGSNVTYTITVANQGSTPRRNVRIIATVPEEQEYLLAEGPTGTSVHGKTLTFEALPRLAPGSVAVWRILCRATRVASVRFRVKLDIDSVGGISVDTTESTDQY